MPDPNPEPIYAKVRALVVEQAQILAAIDGDGIGPIHAHGAARDLTLMLDHARAELMANPALMQPVAANVAPEPAESAALEPAE